MEPSSCDKKKWAAGVFECQRRGQPRHQRRATHPQATTFRPNRPRSQERHTVKSASSRRAAGLGARARGAAERLARASGGGAVVKASPGRACRLGMRCPTATPQFRGRNMAMRHALTHRRAAHRRVATRHCNPPPPLACAWLTVQGRPQTPRLFQPPRRRAESRQCRWSALRMRHPRRARRRRQSRAAPPRDPPAGRGAPCGGARPRRRPGRPPSGRSSRAAPAQSDGRWSPPLVHAPPEHAGPSPRFGRAARHSHASSSLLLPARHSHHSPLLPGQKCAAQKTTTTGAPPLTRRRRPPAPPQRHHPRAGHVPGAPRARRARGAAAAGARQYERVAAVRCGADQQRRPHPWWVAGLVL